MTGGATAGPADVVRRLIEKVMNAGRIEVIDEIYAPRPRQRGDGSRRFASRFPTSGWRSSSWSASASAPSGASAARGRSSAHGGANPPSSRRFERVDEVYFFTITEGRIVAAWGLEDQLSRERQLSLVPVHTNEIPDGAHI